VPSPECCRRGGCPRSGSDGSPTKAAVCAWKRRSVQASPGTRTRVSAAMSPFPPLRVAPCALRSLDRSAGRETRHGADSTGLRTSAFRSEPVPGANPGRAPVARFIGPAPAVPRGWNPVNPCSQVPENTGVQALFQALFVDKPERCPMVCARFGPINGDRAKPVLRPFVAV
jgi:hypothetical protein